MSKWNSIHEKIKYKDDEFFDSIDKSAICHEAYAKFHNIFIDNLERVMSIRINGEEGL